MNKALESEISAIVEKITNKVEQEYNSFKDFMSTQTGLYVFNHSSQCSSKIDLYRYFYNCEFSYYIENRITKETDTGLKWTLEKLKEFLEKNILDLLYNSYMQSEHIDLNSLNNLNDLIRYVIFDEII